MPTLDQQNTGGTMATANGVRYGTTLDSQGFKFQAVNTGTLTSVNLAITKNGTPSGNWFVEIYAASGNEPTGSVLATSENVASSGISTYVNVDTYDDQSFTFSSSFTMNSGSAYFIRLTGDQAYNTSNFLWLHSFGSGDGIANQGPRLTYNTTNWYNPDGGTNYRYSFFKVYYEAAASIAASRRIVNSG